MERKFIENIIYAEHNFPRLFSNMQCTNYGILFFNENIKMSYDSNHAIIMDKFGNDYDQIIDEIIYFYESKIITPRVYSSLKNGQINILEKLLLNKYFIVEKHKNKYLIQKLKCLINIPHTLKIERIDNVQKLTSMENFYDNEWEFPLLKAKIENKNYHFFAGYKDDTAVTICAIQYIDDIGRIDDIETKEKHRGKGYSRQMISHLVKYHQENCNNKVLYLWYNNPIAGKIYREAGFVDLENDFESWVAYKK